MPVLSFCLTVYAPSISHAFQNRATLVKTKVASVIAHVPAPAAPTPVADVADSGTGTLPPGSANLVNPIAPLTVQTCTDGPVPITAIVGGTAGSRRSLIRQGVDQFVKDAGAAAGLNGTFFANASLEGTDNLLIGPSLCDNDAHLLTSPFDQKPQLDGRPMVLMSAKRTLVIPYDSATMTDDTNLRTFLPDMKDAFLGGVWLVHNGIAIDSQGINGYHMKDAMDPRRRAFFGITTDGRPVLGATTYVGTSLQLAQAAQQMGLQEAVLLDSGFSTSLVFGDKILVTGHTSPGIPSRPVPQAILLYGQPAPETVVQVASMTESVATGLASDVVAARRHRRHKILS